MMSVFRIPGSCSAPNTTVPPAFADWLLAEPVLATINDANTAPTSSQSLYRCIDPSKVDGAARLLRPALARNGAPALWFVTSSYSRSHRAYDVVPNARLPTSSRLARLLVGNEQRGAGRFVDSKG